MRGATFAADRRHPPIPVPAIVAPAAVRVAFHCTKRAAGAAMRPPSGSAMAADQGLQFFCGWSRLPLRAAMAMLPAVQVAPRSSAGPIARRSRHRKRRFQACLRAPVPDRSGRLCPRCRWPRRACHPAPVWKRGDLRGRRGEQRGVQHIGIDAVDVCPYCRSPAARGPAHRTEWHRPRPAHGSRFFCGLPLGSMRYTSDPVTDTPLPAGAMDAGGGAAECGCNWPPGGRGRRGGGGRWRRRRRGRRALLAAHARGVNGAIRATATAVTSLLLIWYSTKPSPGRRNPHHQAAWVGADDHVAGGVQGHGAHVRLVALVQHAALAVRRDPMRPRPDRRWPPVNRPSLLKASAQMYFALGS